MVNKETDPFGFSEGARVALEQTHQAPQRFHSRASLVPKSSDYNHSSGKVGCQGVRGQSRNIQFVR